MTKKSGTAWRLITICILIFGICFTFVICKNYIKNMEHYREVWENPVSVTATVTKHKSYDDDGDTDYRSYVQYEYNGITYSGKKYEDKDKKEQLTPVGESVTVKVSPKDAGTLMSELKSKMLSAPFYFVIFNIMLAAIYNFAFRSPFLRKPEKEPDVKYMEKEAKFKILGRFFPIFFMLCCISHSFLYWRYSFIFDLWLQVFGFIFLAIGIWLIFRSMRDYNAVETGTYTISYDVLVEKDISSDSDGDTYYLIYQCGDRTWKKSVSGYKYHAASIGSKVLAFYLPNAKRPIVHYEANSESKYLKV